MKAAGSRLEGPNLVLEPFSDRFISEDYLGWLESEETTRWLVKAGSSVGLEEIRAFCHQMMESPDDYFFAILTRATERHIGNVRIGPIDWTTGTSRFGMMIGDSESRGRGLGVEVMRLVEQFCFDRLRLLALRFPVVKAHGMALRMYEKAGYVVEGPWPEPFEKDGRSHTMVTVAKSRPG